ncbi:cytochrome c [Tamlana sp. 2201CG12-4]|uniref:c-type cytochrome n=1 Tax=Tamlana sp. 2201CG12-4 TaxID=3112582 RepID=UPI002DB628C6|nr:cytochrome c [Tamlana sp. 2201CG12-4]MEC3907014.1 cytochrome c [Tamlana sp. 2201CG12-4]
MKSIIVSILGMASIFVFQLKNQDSLKTSIERGSQVYKDFCVSCHMTYGEGIKNVYPPLSKSDYLKNNREGSIKAIKFGQKGKLVVNGVTYNGYMAPLGLTNREVADVMNYITNTWSNKNKTMITEKEVAKVKK